MPSSSALFPNEYELSLRSSSFDLCQEFVSFLISAWFWTVSHSQKKIAQHLIFQGFIFLWTIFISWPLKYSSLNLSYLQDFKAVAFAYYKYVWLPNLGEEGEAVKGKEESIQYY